MVDMSEELPRGRAEVEITWKGKTVRGAWEGDCTGGGVTGSPAFLRVCRDIDASVGMLSMPQMIGPMLSGRHKTVLEGFLTLLDAAKAQGCSYRVIYLHEPEIPEGLVF
jgi:hypothetical protein